MRSRRPMPATPTWWGPPLWAPPRRRSTGHLPRMTSPRSSPRRKAAWRPHQPSPMALMSILKESAAVVMPARSPAPRQLTHCARAWPPTARHTPPPSRSPSRRSRPAAHRPASPTPPQLPRRLGRISCTPRLHAPTVVRGLACQSVQESIFVQHREVFGQVPRGEIENSAQVFEVNPVPGGQDRQDRSPVTDPGASVTVVDSQRISPSSINRIGSSSSFPR